MNLRTKIHPAHKLEYMIYGPDYIVVGAARWLMKVTDLPRIWSPSRFLTELEAKEFLSNLSEDDAVTMKDVKKTSAQARWYGR